MPLPEIRQRARPAATLPHRPQVSLTKTVCPERASRGSEIARLPISPRRVLSAHGLLGTGGEQPRGECRRSRSNRSSAPGPHDAAPIRRSPAAVQPRVPRRRERPGVARRGAGRPISARPGRSSSATTRCRPSTAASAITRARTRATARTSMSAVSIHAVERFLGDMALARRLDRPTAASPVRKAGARRRRRTERPVDRVAPGVAGSHGGHPRSRTDGRRHDALRHPEVPPAARSARRRNRAHRRTWASRSSSITRSRTSWPRRRRAGSTRCSSRSARISASGRTSRRAMPARSTTRCSFCKDVERRRRAAEDRSARRDLRRRQHRDGCGADRRAGSAPSR